MKTATIFHDSYAGDYFEGSCGIVAHFFKKAFSELGYAVQEVYKPTSDKVSPIALPNPEYNSESDLHFFFEELFPRAEKNEVFSNALNIAFFNLPFFSTLESFCEADGVLFNSKYLMNCFVNQLKVRKLKIPLVDYVPLPLPLLDYPNGYSSLGVGITMGALRKLNADTFVGHAMRPQKQDYFATLAIMYNLNQLAQKYSLKPFTLIVSKSDVESYKSQLKIMPIEQDTFEKFFYPLPSLHNRAMISVMKNSRFSLCYDTFLEAFGYYAIESIYCGSPIFTNGQANLRHILPPDHGIFVNEDFKMHFGDFRARINAYSKVAEKIVSCMQHPQDVKRDCNRGKKYIEKTYNLNELIIRLKSHLGRIQRNRTKNKLSKPSSKVQIKNNPYLRLADWKNGNFITDRGSFNLHIPYSFHEKLGRKK